QQFAFGDREPGENDLDLFGPDVAGQLARDVAEQGARVARVAGDAQGAQPFQVEQQVPAGLRADRDQGGQRRHVVGHVGQHGTAGQGPLFSPVQPWWGRVVAGSAEQDLYVAAGDPGADDVGQGGLVAVGEPGGEVTQGGVEPVDIGGLFDDAQVPF